MIRDDNAIRQDIVEHLTWDSRVNSINIEVQVKDGDVQLVGTTPTYSERMAAYEDTWSVPGVVSVENRIVVTPPES